MPRSIATTLVLAAGLLSMQPTEAYAQSSARFADVPQSPRGRGGADSPSPSPASALGEVRREAPLSSAECGAAELLVWRARRYLERAWVLQAITAYTRAISLHPDCGAAVLELAELRSRLGDFREAERLYGMAVRQRDQAPAAYRARALMRRHQGKRDEALEDLRAAVALRPGDVESVRELARWYVEQRAWTAALSQYRALVRLLSETGSTPELQQARLQVRALTIMAAETDPVSEGGTSENWIRKSMSKLAAQ